MNVSDSSKLVILPGGCNVNENMTRRSYLKQNPRNQHQSKLLQVSKECSFSSCIICSRIAMGSPHCRTRITASVDVMRTVSKCKIITKSIMSTEGHRNRLFLVKQISDWENTTLVYCDVLGLRVSFKMLGRSQNCFQYSGSASNPRVLVWVYAHFFWVEHPVPDVHLGCLVNAL